MGMTPHVGVCFHLFLLSLVMSTQAITIHKAQGMSIDYCEAHIRDCFDSGQAYVALSRARTLEGWYWNLYFGFMFLHDIY